MNSSGAEALLLAGDLAGAKAAAVALVESEPASALHLLGLIEAKEGRTDKAIALLREAIAADPSARAPYRNAASLYLACRNWQNARELLEQGTAAYPDDAGLQAMLGEALLGCGVAEESLNAYHRAYELDGSVDSALGMAKALRALRRYEAAATIAEAIVSESPTAEAHALLAGLYRVTGRSHLVLAQREAAYRLAPGNRGAQTKLAAAYWDSGDLDRCLALTGPLVDAGLATRALHSFHLSGLAHHGNQQVDSLRNAHQDWAALHTRGIEPFTAWDNAFDEQRRPLRIGYLGRDFYFNPSAHFLLPWFRHHDARQFAVYGYDLLGKQDTAAAEFRSLAAHWRACRDKADREILEQVRADRIDILIDTTGHFAGNRLHLFHHRAAPVQVALLSYPATTGLSTFDAIVSDEWACPAGRLERQHTEPVVRLKTGFLTYAPPADAPEVSAHLSDEPVCFGLFQRPVKLSRSNWDAMAAVLRATPGSRLLIHNVFEQLESPESYMHQLYVREFGVRGVEKDRLLFAGPAPYREHLAILGRADIALDSFPYNGMTTTCECLWMGVPVVTLTGECHVARVGRSILHRAGFPEWECSTAEEYIRTAVQLASSRDALRQLRLSMRAVVGESALVDGETSTKEMEMALSTLWRRRCRHHNKKNEEAAHNATC